MVTQVRSLAASNLHLARTPLVGRNREVAEVCQLLLRDDVPLLTLSGPGGVGKTRLAQQVAADLSDSFADGISFVGLATTREPERVALTLAESLNVPEVGGRSPAEAIRASLQHRELLLVLDNFEHVVDAAPLVTELLTSCPRLKILVTSRTLLRLSDERDYPVLPLAVPDTNRLPPLVELAHIDGIALFVARAAAVTPGFALTDANAAAVAEICTRLDGLPLAIELAAARCRLMTPTALAARLTHRLALLTGGARDQPGRLRSLRDALAWSHDLLSPAEQLLFRRLAVFVGGFTLDAAAWVSGVGREASGAPGMAPACGSQDLHPDTAHVLDLVGSLVDQNLLRREDQPDGEPRFSMLETVREYALDRLEQSGEADAVRRRHADWFAALADEADVELRGREQLRWLSQLEADHDNLRAAMALALNRQDAGLALRLAGALHWFWFHHGHWAEGRRWLERALSAPGAKAPTRERARALAGAGLLSFTLSDYASSRAWLEESIAVSLGVGDHRGVAYATLCMAWPTLVQGDYTSMHSLATESLTRFRALNDRWGEVAALCSLGCAEMDVHSDMTQARVLCEESLAGANALGDAWSIARASNCLGELARGEGELDRATALYEEALTRFRRLGQSKHVPLVLHNLGQVAALRGDARQGAQFFAEGLSLQTDLDDRRGQACCLTGLAAMAALLRQAMTAARLFGAADALIESTGVVMESLDLAACEPQRVAARRQLGAVAFAAAWESGAALPRQQAIAEALAFAAQVAAKHDAAEAPSPTMGLSSRELDILRLLVEGHSNPEIAAALFISHKTVRNHVTNILDKLGVESRTAAATLALRQGIV